MRNKKSKHLFASSLAIYIFTFFGATKIFTSTITYELSGGRLGDNLVAYIHAKWISYKHDIPLEYKPFEHSNELVLCQQERLFNQKQKYYQIKKLPRVTTFSTSSLPEAENQNPGSFLT